MMQLDRLTLGRMAKELGFVRDTLEKVCRLADVLKFMESDELLSEAIALKGGTAINLTKRIVEASQTESLTFFVGAGVSKLSDAPKWSELIDAFSDSLGRDRKSNYSNEEYLSIPQMYCY